MKFHIGDYSLCGFFNTSLTFGVGFDDGDNASVTVNGGGVTVGGDLYISNGSSGRTGTLTINGGKVSVASNKETLLYYGSTLNLNGGILETASVRRPAGTGDNHVINFNGGTLKSNRTGSGRFIMGNGSQLKVNVLEKGGVIDCDDYDVTLENFNGFTGTGRLTFTGGHTITIDDPRNYTCTASITPGTRLAVWNLGASKKVIANGLVVAGMPVQGDVIFTCTRGDGYTLDGVSLDNVTCPIAPGTTFDLDESKTNIVVTSVGAVLPACWTGAAGDNNLSTAGNWSDNAVPGPGTNANIFCAGPTTLTNGAGFAPSAITFLEGCAPVTIDGDDCTGIVAVTNLSSSVSHTINAKVYFAGDIQVKQAAMADVGDLKKAHVTFAGGAYAAAGCSLENGDFTPIYSRCIFGKYYFATTATAGTWNGWSAFYSGVKRVCMADGSYLYVPYANRLNELYVGNGAKVDIGTTHTDSRLSYMVNGEMVVTNLTQAATAERFVTFGQGTTTPGVFKFGTVTNRMNPTSGGAMFRFADGNAAGRHVFYIGEGGLNFNTSLSNQSSIYVIGRSDAGNHETIRPWYSDFTIRARPGTAAGLRFFGEVEFCTDDENGTGRTITLEAKTQVQSGKTAAITVSGSGTLEVTQPDKNENTATVSVTLTDTATLVYTNATATLGGDITLGAGTTLALTSTGSTFMALTNTLNLPTEGKATLRINGDKLKGGDHVIATVGTGATANIVLDPASTVLDGRKGSLRVESGSLVLTVKTKGTILIVK